MRAYDSTDGMYTEAGRPGRRLSPPWPRLWVWHSAALAASHQAALSAGAPAASTYGADLMCLPEAGCTRLSPGLAAFVTFVVSGLFHDYAFAACSGGHGLGEAGDDRDAGELIDGAGDDGLEFEEGVLSHGLGDRGGKGLARFNEALRRGESTFRIVLAKRTSR